MGSPNDEVKFAFDSTLLSGGNIGANLRARPLASDDYAKGYFEVLRQLTEAPIVSKEVFLEQFNSIKQHGSQYPVVIEDTLSSKIVAAGSIIIERKFVHGCGRAGHIEDIVVDSGQRGKNLGRHIIEELKHIGKVLGCYKVILDCKESNVGFYEKLGFARKEVEMVLYFNKSENPTTNLPLLPPLPPS